MGVHSQILEIGGMGKGIHMRVPHIIDSGKGVHSKTPYARDAEVPGAFRPEIYVWFRKLQERLRLVRVVCGDWSRVCGGNWQDNMGTVGFFFDPPYGVKDRKSVYDYDSTSVAEEVLRYCLKCGTNPNYRIVLCGYEEHESLLRVGWTSEVWKANGGYGNIGSGRGKANASRERIYYSPYCFKDAELFDEN